MENTQHPTSNIQHPTVVRSRAQNNWMLVVGCWLLDVVFYSSLFAPLCLWAQTPPQIPPAIQAQLQVQQPAVDITSPVTATAAFDSPVARVGERTFYRVSVDATESSITWPAEIAAPTELKFGAHVRAQLTQLQAGRFRPLTSFVYEVEPSVAGHFTVPNFTVTVSGEPVEIPAASLDAGVANSGSPPRRLGMEISATNVFLGQPFHVRVLLPTGPANEIEALREIQFNGDGLMTDKTAMRQSIEIISANGVLRPAFICDMTVTPIAAGPLKFSAQGFTAGREFMGPISIRGQVSLPGGPANYVLLVSDLVQINVRPLPAEGELPGFTGTIGKFLRDPPLLATNRLRVGEPVHLKLAFHGEGDLTRLVPPDAPRSRDWQIIADSPPTTGFTLIPLIDAATNTPAIPFSCFDPATARYADLTIPPLPVTVVGEGLPVELRAADAAAPTAAPLKLSGLAATPGKTASSLMPLQLRGWFVGVQLAPVAGFLALWQWDRRRRYLEAHPDIVRRRRARRELRREKNLLRNAVTAGDPEGFVRHAAAAMRIATAPHFPAEARALVGGDVLAQLDEAVRNGRAGETVKKIFAADDAQFAQGAAIEAGWLALKPDVDAVLLKLEERL